MTSYFVNNTEPQKEKLFKHFIPTENLTQDEADVSSVFAVFAFQKKSLDVL